MMKDRVTASDMTAAMRMRERDMRARLLADSCVAMAMQELSDECPETEWKAREYAHRVAQFATALLVSGIYIGDEEIRALREERDAYKEQALQFASSVARPLFVAEPDRRP